MTDAEKIDQLMNLIWDCRMVIDGLYRAENRGMQPVGNDLYQVSYDVNRMRKLQRRLIEIAPYPNSTKA